MDYSLGLLPCLSSDMPLLDQAFRLALAGVAGNTLCVEKGVLKGAQPCVMAGMDYASPWTRDAAINVYFAVALMDPALARNTLLSVLEERNGSVYIGGQYWDKIIWSIGAHRLWQVTGDREFLAFAHGVIARTLAEQEAEEQDPADGLFRGAAVYGDGVSAYPEKYRNPDLSSGIIRWPGWHPDQAAPIGGGLPMKALSTNCVYYRTYCILTEMAAALGIPDEVSAVKAETLKTAINRAFWNPATGLYDYLCGECDAQEGLGLAFAILFGVADEAQCASIVSHAHLTPQGIPCVWPAFPPYCDNGYGRHSGTVWPHVQGFWALAMSKLGRTDLFAHELLALARNAVRDHQFAEIYHPEDGRIYGGLQEGDGEYILWNSCTWQTWSATAYLSMIMDGMFGLQADGAQGQGRLPKEVSWARLDNLHVRGQRIDLTI